MVRGQLSGNRQRLTASEQAAQLRDRTAGRLPMRPFGRTGFDIGVFSLGGQALLQYGADAEAAVALIERALDLGVNYLDTAPRYGPSQDRLGAVMQRRRGEVFLASKTHDRTRDGSLRLLEDSLKRLRTDHLDLWQVHNLTTADEVEVIFAKGGAIEALEEARAQGLVRFVGVTGHYDPAVLVQAIERYPFDTVLCALNAADTHYLSFNDALLPVANARQMGIIGMKVTGLGRVFRPGGVTTMRQAMSYVLTLPITTVIVGCSTVAEVEENVAIARAFVPLTPAEMAKIGRLTASYAPEASWFKRWETVAMTAP
jgi:aryl-alcohol dehydrogenase-like predicted oxidoreductase